VWWSPGLMEPVVVVNRCLSRICTWVGRADGARRGLEHAVVVNRCLSRICKWVGRADGARRGLEHAVVVNRCLSGICKWVGRAQHYESGFQSTGVGRFSATHARARMQRYLAVSPSAR
jgi:hypothetical protein